MPPTPDPVRPRGAAARFPRWVYARGAEPDPRFSLANERTFLAWIRTALALVAAGVAVEAVPLGLDPRLRTVTATVFVLVGVVSGGQSWLGWARTERSLRVGAALPGGGVLVGAVLLALGLFG